MRCIQLRSAPAEKLLPAPASTTHAHRRRRRRAPSNAVGELARSVRRRRRCARSRPVERDAVATAVVDARQDSASVMRRSHPEHAEARRSGIGAFSAADRPRPSTMRVSAGSMMPSSHSRARGVVGMALALVLLADRRLERVFLLGATSCRPWPRCRRARPWPARSPPARRPSRRCARWATSTGSAADRRGRTCRSCRRRSCRR